MKSKKIIQFFSFILIIFLDVILSHGKVIFKEYYKGIPEYEKKSPFLLETEPNIQKELRTIIKEAEISKNECESGSINVPGLSTYILKSNSCKPADYVRIKAILKKLAPSLEQSRLTFWIYDIDNDKEPELVIGYIDLIGDEQVKDPYLSLWLLKYNEEKYHVVYAGPFLNGEINGVGYFGPEKSHEMVFIKHQSCTECEPWIYLTIIDFLKGPNGDAFSFTYSTDHKDFAPTIEYILPGMGHSVDADVETRIPTMFIKGGPHLIQNYKMKDKTEEWWLFTCRDLKCDYEFFKNTLPQKYKNLWKKAKKI